MRSFSYSEYSYASECLRKYKHIVIDKIQGQGATSGDMIFGSALHSGISASFSGLDATTVFKTYWESEKDKAHQYSRYKWPELGALGIQFLDKFERLHRKKFKATQTETRLKGQYKDLPLEGTPDFIGMYNDKRSLWDWKTAAYNYAKEKSEISLQLNIYAHLCIQTTGFEPEVLGYLVFNKGTGGIQTMVWDFSYEKMRAMLDDAYDVCRNVNERITYPKNPNACIFSTRVCQFFNQCWKGNETHE